jgi:hypothetical protein
MVALDASPRGDAPGFVAVQDERTLLLPERRGNNRIDSLRNILGDPRVAKRTTVSFDLPETLDILERTPTVVGALLRGTSASWHDVDEGPDTWSAFDVVGHLIHGEETDWVPRARIILEHGESRPFEPFDRFAQLNRFAGWSLDHLLDRFTELRQANLEIVRSWRLTEAQLVLPGRHPELGSVDLRQLLATWAVHDLNHISQIARVMAKRYTQEVGVWRAYLSILNR